ncbi:hypothetical protein EAF00_006683 [Botryotinia globosa]|nr:hypothetical protein EAF00_006683 [Botryotinia globosa]
MAKVSGCFMIVLGTMMLSLSTKYYQIILSQGIVIGLGAGLVYIPALAITSTRFTTKRPFAIGCASSGSSIVLITLIWHGTTDTKPKSATKKAIFDFKAFTELPFLGFAVSLLLIFVAFYIPLFYIPSYAIYRLKNDENLSFYLLAITNAGSFFGRTVPFLIANRVAPAAAVTHPTLSTSMSVIGTRLGMSWITAAIGILIGPPIAGALVDLNTAYFIKAIVFAGVVMAAGAVFLMPPLLTAMKYKPVED